MFKNGVLFDKNYFFSRSHIEAGLSVDTSLFLLKSLLVNQLLNEQNFPVGIESTHFIDLLTSAK